jgi:hypothetical protein
MVREAISLVFNKFIELGTVRQTLMWFIENGLQFSLEASFVCARVSHADESSL